MSKKITGYLELNDSKNALEVFGQESPESGYELVFRIDYGVSKEEVESLLSNVLDLIDLENVDLVNSERYNSKFQV